MDAREANRRTVAAYEEHIEDYLAELTTTPNDTLAALFDRLARLAPGGTVLELGTGPGDWAVELERRGLTVRRTDVTVAFVERLRDQGHEADVLDALHADLGGPYDVLLAIAVLLHFSRDDLAELLQRATASARWLAFTVKVGDGETWSARKFGTPRWFVYWREPDLRALVERAGWRILSLQTNSGRDEDWLTVLAERA